MASRAPAFSAADMPGDDFVPDVRLKAALYQTRRAVDGSPAAAGLDELPQDAPIKAA